MKEESESKFYLFSIQKQEPLLLENNFCVKFDYSFQGYIQINEVNKKKERKKILPLRPSK